MGDTASVYVEGFKSQVKDHLSEVKNFIFSAKEGLQSRLEDSIIYVKSLNTMSKEDILADFKQWKWTPITISTLFGILAAFYLLGRKGNQPRALQGSKPKKNSKKKTGKKLSKAQKANSDVQGILDYIKGKIVPEIDNYMQNYKNMKEENMQYTYNYFQETLLKELMKLDGVDINGNEIVRENRRKVINFIQGHQKRLDLFKKKISNNQ